MNKILVAFEKLTNCKCSSLSEQFECIEIIRMALKVLEIVKKKEVEINYLRQCFLLEHYNARFSTRWQQLTQEEFNLLKEVLL